MGRHFTEILATVWRGVLVRSWNSERLLVFAHVFHANTLDVSRAQKIRALITRHMELWERGLHAGLVVDSKAEEAAREGRATSGGKEDDDAVVRSYHDKVLPSKLRQAACRETNREGGGCLLLDDQCTKTG